MATLTGLRASTTFPVFSNPAGGNNLQVAYGYYDVAVDPAPADDYALCWVPPGAVICGGFLYAADLDSNATETFDADLGWAANGGSGTYDAVDTDGLGNFGIWVGDAFAGGNILGVAGNCFVLAGILATGIFPYFTKKTLIQLTVVDDAATIAAGRVSVAIHYFVDPTLAA